MAKDRSRNKQVAVAVFDPTSNGTLATNATYGANTTTAGGGQTGKVIIPEGALITKVYTHVETAITDDGDNSTTISLGYTGALAAFLAATAINATVWAAGSHNTLVGYPNLGADAAHDSQLEVAALYAATYIAVTTDVEVLITLNNDHAVDAGKVTVFVEYVQTGDLS